MFCFKFKRGVKAMSSKPISVIVDHMVCPRNKKEFEHLLKSILEESSKFRGYIDSKLIKPKKEEDPNYRVMFRFDTQENLDKWLVSNVRFHYIEKIEALTEKPTVLQVITGLESWFALPGQQTLTPPPRYKMAIVTWVAITSLLLVFNFIMGPILKELPFVLRIVITTSCIVLIMTYLWMPFITKLFKSWLYPKKS